MILSKQFLIIFTLFLLAMLFFSCTTEPLNAQQANEKECSCYQLLPPADEGGCDETFQEFKKRFREAVAQKDAQFIEKIIDSNIVMTYKDENGKQVTGKENFLNKWIRDDKSDDLWETLTAILLMGGTCEQKDQYFAPYVYAKWPSFFIPSAYAAIIEKDVRVYEQPGENEIARLSYAIVQVDWGWKGEDDNLEKYKEWEKVVISDGREGYVLSRMLRRKYDWHLGFQKENDGWRMKFLVQKPLDRGLPPPHQY